jgi:hypothetical protein
MNIQLIGAQGRKMDGIRLPLWTEAKKALREQPINLNRNHFGSEQQKYEIARSFVASYE